MKESELKRIRERLVVERSRIEHDVETLETEGHEALSEASGENNYRDHMADQGTATFSRELDMTLEENLREALAAVHTALARIDEGTYGTCDRCGKKIQDERLEAMPTATLCIQCKSDEESR